MMSAFATNQDRMRQTMQETFGGMFPFANLEELSKQNMALFESAMQAFSPFPVEAQPEQNHAAAPAAGEAKAAALQKLKAQMDALQHQLDSLSAEQPAQDSDKAD